MSALSEIMQALQEIAAAVTANDRNAYVEWVGHARTLGCTDAQIRDAYEHRVSIGAAPDFDRNGEPT